VFENVALPLRYHQNRARHEVETDVRAMLSALELLPWAASTPGALPRPWQKRAGLARALMLRPEVLMLDGPLGGLDLRHINWWLNCLGDLARGHALLDRQPLTLIVTADDLRLWRGRASHFAALVNQRLVLLGNWDEMAAQADPAVRLLLEGHT
jgi:ABC-type transporter Mla maintaining outer membrane lipid asymmetry ATPase subunit MlaF